jgi:hypothetical protein
MPLIVEMGGKRTCIEPCSQLAVLKPDGRLLYPACEIQQAVVRYLTGALRESGGIDASPQNAMYGAGGDAVRLGGESPVSWRRAVDVTGNWPAGQSFCEDKVAFQGAIELGQASKGRCRINKRVYASQRLAT